jgi:hypothetical protein
MKYISLIRSTADKEMIRIFTCGGCYRFYLILKEVFQDAEPYKLINDKGYMYHVMTKINDYYYDILGGYSVNDLKNCTFELMDEEDMKLAESFRYPVIQQKQKDIKNSISIKHYDLRSMIIKGFKYFSYFLVLLGVVFLTYGIYNHVSVNNIFNILMWLFFLLLVTKIFRYQVLNDFSMYSYCPYCGEWIKRDYHTVSDYMKKHYRKLNLHKDVMNNKEGLKWKDH